MGLGLKLLKPNLLLPPLSTASESSLLRKTSRKLVTRPRAPRCDRQRRGGVGVETSSTKSSARVSRRTSDGERRSATEKLVFNEDYLGSEIVSHFVMHGESVAEIVKHLIVVLKKKDGDVLNVFLESLKRAYHRHVVEISKSGEDYLESKTFLECKDLATRLSGMYIGAARNKHRSDILKFVKDGIQYAFLDIPKHLPFLDGAVLHFVSKLPATDVHEILKDVQKRAENVNTDEDPSGWRPYFTFVDNLREKYAKNEGLPDEKEGMPVRRRGRPRKHPKIPGKRLFDGQSSSEEEDSISASDQETHEEEEKQEEEEEVPLIHSIRPSSKLRSLRASREESKGQTRTGDSRRATNNISTSRTSGASN